MSDWAPIPRRCRCLPGTPENGWQEQRCEQCERDYRDGWARFIRRARHLLGPVGAGDQP